MDNLFIFCYIIGLSDRFGVAELLLVVYDKPLLFYYFTQIADHSSEFLTQ